MEDFKRPNHPDFLTGSELAAQGFSGIRHNSITEDCEIWILGRLDRKVTKAQVLADPDAINKAMEEAFSLNDVFPDKDDTRGELQ